jgi:hypothetical protein
MVLLEFAELLNVALEFDRTSGSYSGGSAGQIHRGLSRLPWFRKAFASRSTTSLLQAVRARLGNTPEALNQFTLINHCAEAAKSVQNVGEIMLGELISAMLGYFMMHTVGLHTFGLIYSTRSHPLLSLVEGNPELGFTIVDAKMAGLANLHRDRKSISTAILIVKDAQDAAMFHEQTFQPLTACLAANGIDIMAVADTPEVAAAIANALPERGKCRAVNFPLVMSGLGLSGISVRCILST